MTKFKFTLTLLLSLVASIANAQWISLEKSAIIESIPKVSVLSNTKTSTIINIDLPGFTITNKRVAGLDYHQIDLLTDSNITEVGAPALPLVSNLIAVPDNAAVSVEILETGAITTYENINMLPARESWFEGDEETTYNKNMSRYSASEMYPAQQVTLGKPAIFRDYRIVRIAVSPMQYNPVTKQLSVASSIKVRLNYTNDREAVNPKIKNTKAISPTFDKLYKSSILNYDSIVSTKSTEDEVHDLMLCIVPDALYEDFLPYADWKKRTGIDVHITKFSDIGATATNPITIKNHITDAYNTWDVPPTYVLLVGDDGIVPVKIYNSTYDSYSGAWENYFVEVDGDDYIPDMLIGRLTSKYNYRLKVLLNKFIKYEKEPYIEENAWFRKGLCASNNAYDSQVTTKEFTRDVMLNDGDFTFVDAMMSDGGWGGEGCSYGVGDVVSAINEGRSFVNYRGEGWYDGWHASCTPFGVSDLSSVNSGRKNTFFTSIGCGVANFANSSECFGEKLLELGEEFEQNGAIAFVGPTTNTHTAYNNKMDKGIYVGMFQEAMNTPGEALARGRLYQMNVFGEDDNAVEHHHRLYCVLGDPSIHIWKTTPLAINASHVSFLEVGDNNVAVGVSYQDGGAPVENARVTLTNENGLFATGTTDISGNVIITANIADVGILNVTVIGNDVIPYEGTINMSGIGVTDLENDLTELNSYPNPFMLSTQINYTLLEENQTSLRIYNVNGQIIRNLQNNIQEAGKYSLQWDGLNESGNKLSNGIYYCQLVSGRHTSVIKLVMTK